MDLQYLRVTTHSTEMPRSRKQSIKAGEKQKQSARTKRALMLAAAWIAASFCWFGQGQANVFAAEGPLAPAAAVSVPKLDNIRVMLFGDTPKYRAVIPAVTLSSASPSSLYVRAATGDIPVLTVNPLMPVKVVDADGFSARVLETGDASAARLLAEALTAKAEPVSLVERVKSGQRVWQVLIGPYATKAEADAAGLRAAALGAGAATVLGPLRLATGHYISKEDAQKQADAIALKGFDADIAALPSAASPGASAYEVHVGGALDSSGLQALKAQLSAAIPGAVFIEADQNKVYILLRNELFISGNEAAQGIGAALSGSGAKLRLAPADSSAAVKVKERSARSYRGGIEVSKHGGKLAVINELPFEEYLYSVIGSELSAQWPSEALKAQAVAARTYVLKYGVKYQIAHVTDTTLDQSYKGKEAEFEAGVQAVKATTGEVLADSRGLIEPLYSSNAGGQTADSTEIWGNPVLYLQSSPSPDEGAQAGKLLWHRIVLPNGIVGYIRSDYARSTGAKNPAGWPVYEAVQNGVNVRSAPYVDNTSNPSLIQVNLADRFIVIGEAMESNAYAWIRGPYKAGALLDKINAGSAVKISGSLNQLELTKTGPSGRALVVSANGIPLKPVYPDAYRSLLGGLPSTKFEIEETARYTILGANGTVNTQTAAQAKPHVASAYSPKGVQQTTDLFVLNGSGQARVVTPDAQFIFRGTGFGHGLGMSQWGAKGLAEQGYDYTKILKTYYTGVSIIKG